MGKAARKRKRPTDNAIRGGDAEHGGFAGATLKNPGAAVKRAALAQVQAPLALTERRAGSLAGPDRKIGRYRFSHAILGAVLPLVRAF